MPQPKAFFLTLLIVLVMLNIGNFLLQDRSDLKPVTAFIVPQKIPGYVSEDIQLSPQELAILSPAKVINRKYQKAEVQQVKAPNTWDVIWVNILETTSVSSLHNFYDSLIASGSRPSILKTHIISTQKGPLKTSLIRYYNIQGQAFYLLLWYQWIGGNAENRWQWYWEILKLRLQRENTPWQLIEIATPQTNSQKFLNNSPDIRRLEEFAKSFYESSSYADSTKN